MSAWTTIIEWLNANPGAATVLGGVAATPLFALGWLIVRLLPRSATTSKSKPISTSVLDSILEKRVIRVGVLDYPPLMTFSELNGRVSADGVFPNLIKKIASEHDLKPIWIPLNWSEIIDAVKSDRVDMVCCIFWTQKRSEHATFCAFLHRIGVTGVVRTSEDRIRSHEDLTNPEIRVAVVRGEIGWEYATDMLNFAFERKRFKVLDTYDIRSAADEVKHGVVDILLADALSCRLACMQDGSLKQVFVGDNLYVCDNGIMIKRDDQKLREWLNEHAKRLRRDSEFVAMEDAAISELKGVVQKRPV